MLEQIPGPPDFTLDWEGLDAAYDWVRAMRDCPQDPVYHAEGDVWIHTRMVLRALLDLPAYRQATPEVQRELYLAALLHDVAKPISTQVLDDGRVSARGHSRKGCAMAREILWHAGAPPDLRERIAHMVAHHQLPMWCIERDRPERHVLLASLVCRLDRLSVLAEADMRGRTCVDQANVLEHIELFAALAEEERCATGPAEFPSEHARLTFCRKPEQHRSADPHFEPRCTLTLMCGLPASGKTHWVAEHRADRPVVSLDALRAARGVSHDDEQGGIVQAGKEQARVHLRAGTSFIWDATNLSKRHRAPLVQLGLDYGARVEIVHVESTPEGIRRRNRKRTDPVPQHAVRRMIRRWEPPTLSEAHQVHHVRTE